MVGGLFCFYYIIIDVNIRNLRCISYSCKCIRIIVLCASFFGRISWCSHIYPKGGRGWAQSYPRGHVAGGLGAILAVCRGWQAFLTLGIFWANPRFPRHPASCARTKGVPFHGIPFARVSDPEVIFGRFLLFFCPLMSTAMSKANTQRAQR